MRQKTEIGKDREMRETKKERDKKTKRKGEGESWTVNKVDQR